MAGASDSRWRPRPYLAVAAVGLVAVIGALAAWRGTDDARRDGNGGAGPPASSPAGRIAGRCARVIAPGHPHAVQRLVASLRPGQTGCLRHGTYREDVTVSAHRIALRPYRRGKVRLVGRLWFTREAHDDVVSHLRLDGRNERRLPSPTVNGTRITFAHVGVTNRHTGICFVLGSPRYGRARGTLIRDSRIHDCGKLPAQNHDHGIYVAAADDTRILDNVIYDNADRGIQLYPDAQRTTIRGNVIDGNGEGIIFSGNGSVASSGTLVEHNVIADSRVRADVESFYVRGAPVGVDNVVRDNCIGGGVGGAIDDRAGGFSATLNVQALPAFVDRAAGDFRLVPASPCASVLQRR